MQILRNIFMYGYLFLLTSSMATMLSLTLPLHFWLFNLGMLGGFAVLDKFFKISNIFSSMTLLKWPLYGLISGIVSLAGPALGLSVALVNFISMATPILFELSTQVFTLAVVLGNAAVAPANQIPPRDENNPVFRLPLHPENPLHARDIHMMGPEVGAADNDENNGDLREMAQRGVYGMRRHGGHNRRQRAALDDMRARYQAEFIRRGRPAIYEEIRQYFIQQYNNNPARNLGVALPLAYRGNLFTNHAPYYQHTIHTAYRYLFLRPNPWLSPMAGFTTPVGNGHAATTSDEDLTKIAYMWLAATDPNQRLPEGQTREGLLNEFATAIAELGRAYNHPFGADDLEGDKPTCPAGANQRITQFYMVFLNDQPDTRPLTPDIISQKFKQEMINESPLAGSLYNKMRAMNPADLNHLESGLNKEIMLEDLTPQETAAVNRMNFTAAEINQYIETCKTYFGANRITQRHGDDERLAYMAQRFHSYEEMIRYLGQNAKTLNCQHILRNIEQIRGAQNAEEQPAVRHRRRAAA